MSKQHQQQLQDDEVELQQQPFPEYYLAMNDFLDALQAFPYDIIRQFTLLKEIDAKCVNTQPEVNQQIDEYLEVSNKSKEESDKNDASNFERNKKTKLRLLSSIKELLLNSLPCYEEKLAIANLAIDLVYKNMDRINNDLEVIINKEIPKIIKYGPKNHPAIKQDKNDVSANGNKSVQSQRSESRRQAIAAKRLDSETPQGSQQSVSQQSTVNTKNTRESTPAVRNSGAGKRKHSDKTRNNDKGNDSTKHYSTKEKSSIHKEKNASSKSSTTNSNGNLGSNPLAVIPSTKRQKVESKKEDSKNVKHAEDETNDVYCFCRQVSFGEMIGCDNDNCKIQWFHMQCVGLTSPPKGTWYCEDCRKQYNLR